MAADGCRIRDYSPPTKDWVDKAAKLLVSNAERGTLDPPPVYLPPKVARKGGRRRLRWADNSLGAGPGKSYKLIPARGKMRKVCKKEKGQKVEVKEVMEEVEEEILVPRFIPALKAHLVAARA